MSEVKQQDPLRELADVLRSKEGVETRSSVLGGERVEILRGKDIVRWVKAHPERCSKFLAGGKVPEEQARELGQLLLRRKLLARCERQFKKPQPGAKKLVKFPKKLVYAAPEERGTFAEEGFFAYTYDRPASPWANVWAGLAVLGALLLCMFPLAPNWVKIGVFYLCAALLTLILGLLALRGALAMFTWVLLGRAVWLLPNALSEEVAFKELFSPVVLVEVPEEGGSKWANHPATRLLVGAALGGILYMLHSRGPNAATMAHEAGRYRDDLFDLMGVHKDGYKRVTAGNDTEPAAAAAANASAAAGAGAEGACSAAEGTCAGGKAEEPLGGKERELLEEDEWEFLEEEGEEEEEAAAEEPQDEYE